MELLLEKYKEGGGTWEDLGPTVRAWARGAIPANPYPKTLRKIDAKMDWVEGSTRAVLDGGEPTPLTNPPVPESKQARLKVLGEQLRDVADQLVRELERLE